MKRIVFYLLIEALTAYLLVSYIYGSFIPTEQNIWGKFFAVIGFIFFAAVTVSSNENVK